MSTWRYLQRFITQHRHTAPEKHDTGEPLITKCKRMIRSEPQIPIPTTRCTARCTSSSVSPCLRESLESGDPNADGQAADRRDFCGSAQLQNWRRGLRTVERRYAGRPGWRRGLWTCGVALLLSGWNERQPFGSACRTTPVCYSARPAGTMKSRRERLVGSNVPRAPRCRPTRFYPARSGRTVHQEDSRTTAGFKGSRLRRDLGRRARTAGSCILGITAP
jgi:hypothetical protein